MRRPVAHAFDGASDGHASQRVGASHTPAQEIGSTQLHEPVNPQQRLKVARQWLDLETASVAGLPRAQRSDRDVFAWSAAAAVRGDPEGQLLLGRCFAAGRGIAKNLDQARKWFRRAAAAGSTEAQYRLRALRFDHHRWLRHAHALMGGLGLVLLVVHAIVEGVSVSPKGVLAYLALSMAALPIYFLMHAGRRGRPARREAPDYVYDQHVRSWRERPWRVAWVGTEDGVFLAPLVWLGITPASAVLAGVLFGLAHYPSFSPRVCALKAVEYAAIAWFVLPWAGLWSIVFGHVLWDAALLALGARSHRRRQGYAMAS